MAAMRLQILSDQHTEFGRCEVPRTDADVVVFAGDVGRLTRGAEFIASLGLPQPAVYVAGNHEYYGGAVPRTTQKIRTASEALGVHFLENDFVDLAGVRFLGCTLWTDFDLFGPQRVIPCAIEAAAKMNDFRLIRVSPEFRRFTPKDAAAVHRRSVAWLRRAAAESPLPVVVVTHHAPSIECVDPARRDDPVTAAYASDLRPLLAEIRPRLWVSGHTHYPIDTTVEGVRLVSNARGYPGEVARGFDSGLVVDVPL